MTTHHAAAATGLPEYDDDRVLYDLSILQRHLSAAAEIYVGEWREKDEGLKQVFALIETSRVYVDSIHRSLHAAAYPNSPEVIA